MAYTNNGYARNTVLTVNKGDYSHDYSLLDSFPYPGQDPVKLYPKITAEQFALLDDKSYEQRMDDFILYVYSIEEGLETDCPDLTQGSVEYDTVLCPLTQVVGQQQEEE